jgi:hypothetical protein
MAGVSGAHPDIGPELRQLAQAILDRLDPAVRSAAALAAGGDGAAKCQQVWCPVCALAALVSGEQHPLLTVIAEQSVALLAAVRAMVADLESSDGPSKPPPDGDEPPPSGPSRYQHIAVTVEE